MNYEKEKVEALLPIEIPSGQLPEETLTHIIDSFIMREGTDYGSHEVDHAEKRDQVLKQLNCGKIKLLFDPNTESVTLISANDLQRMKR